MKKSNYSKFMNFKHNHKLNNTQIAEIALEYANSADEFARTFLTTKYGISKYVFYKCLDYAIIYMLVDANTCKKIRSKRLRNQGSHNQSGNYTSALYHDRTLMSLRKEYLGNFSEKEIRQIAALYANNYSLYEIGQRHNISEYCVRKLLAISVREHLLDKETYLKLKDRSDRTVANRKDYFGPSCQDLWNN